MKKILMADDDAGIRELLSFYLRQADFDITIAVDGQQALDIARNEKFDLLLLDVMMPYLSGIDIVKKLRAEGNFTPILVLTARDDDEMKLLGLGLGADDYLDKTTSMSEIVVRVEGLIRRAQTYSTVQSDKKEEIVPFDNNNLEINFQKKTVKLSGSAVELTKREFEILDFLIQHQGKIVSRNELLQKFWGINDDEAETRTMDVLVGRLRKKLDHHYIKSKRGYGYYFEDSRDSAEI
ncbi:MAG: response regulator transcription factor [Streptococcaceae bacterium]|jgi:DNA-binding response OmpR family regulator|nr:response regulator transcription factor [Streptococcaceae bacterium]